MNLNTDFDYINSFETFSLSTNFDIKKIVNQLCPFKKEWLDQENTIGMNYGRYFGNLYFKITIINLKLCESSIFRIGVSDKNLGEDTKFIIDFYMNIIVTEKNIIIKYSSGDISSFEDKIFKFSPIGCTNRIEFIEKFLKDGMRQFYGITSGILKLSNKTLIINDNNIEQLMRLYCIFPDVLLGYESLTSIKVLEDVKKIYNNLQKIKEIVIFRQ